MECHTYSMRSENKKKYIKKGRRSPKSCDNIQWVMAMTGTTSIFLCKYILYVKSLNDCRLFCTLHSSPNAACTASDVCVFLHHCRLFFHLTTFDVSFDAATRRKRLHIDDVTQCAIARINNIIIVAVHIVYFGHMKILHGFLCC